MEEFEVPEKPDNQKEKSVGLIIAVIAVVLAIVTALGHQVHNEEILAHVDGADQFVSYQAKKSRQVELESKTALIQLGYDHLSPTAQQKADGILAKDGAEIQHLSAGEKEAQDKGDEFFAEATRLAKKAGVLDLGEIALQISVVLCSITILTELFLFVRMGVGTAVIGVLTAAYALFLL